jgi:hypothetical protein
MTFRAAQLTPVNEHIRQQNYAKPLRIRQIREYKARASRALELPPGNEAHRET